MAQRSSRKRRKRRRRAAHEGTAAGYARVREKDAAARAALEPLAPGERPTAVTVGAVGATILCVANLVALAIGFEPGDREQPAITILGAVILAVLAWGMWRARYWAVLGMETILAIAIVSASIALVSASNLAAVVLVLVIIGSAGTLFWFLVKAMARIQMPPRPGTR